MTIKFLSYSLIVMMIVGCADRSRNKNLFINKSINNQHHSNLIESNNQSDQEQTVDKSDKPTLDSIGFTKEYDEQDNYTTIYKSESLIVVTDIHLGSIWVKNDKQFKQIKKDITIHKTYGGHFGYLPAKIINDKIAYPQTIRSIEGFKNDGIFPIAIAQTILIDVNGTEVDRSIEYTYDHTPWLCINEKWKE